VNVVSVSFGARFSWMKEISKDELMTAFTFLSPANGVKNDHHVNRPYA
jgi:hypothetical protein